jgi:hypothetical protein
MESIGDNPFGSFPENTSAPGLIRPIPLEVRELPNSRKYSWAQAVEAMRVTALVMGRIRPRIGFIQGSW